MFWTMIIRIWRINVFCEDSNKLQESAVFHDHKAIDTLTDMMSWVSITIWLQNHVSIWQARSEIWHTYIMITKLAHEHEWWTNHELILNFIIFKMIWENTTYFYKSQTQWRKNWNQQIRYEFW